MSREMKWTGVEWLGEIPESWTTPKLLYVLREKICDGPHETPNYKEEGIPFISIDSLNESKDINFSIVKRFISKEDYDLYSKKTRIKEGDILFSKAATIGKTAIVGKEVFMVWSPLAVIKRDTDKVDNDYLYYLLNCNHLVRHIALSGSMNTQINVGMRELEQARIPLPPIHEQLSIAACLDSECYRIDSVIEQTRASIEEYKKLKQAVIMQAVTKGLRPNREMKASGIEWIGMIPSDWGTIRFKYLHDEMNTGEGIDKEYWSSDEKDTVFYTAGVEPIRTNYQEFPSWKYTKGNDLLLARNGTPYVYLPDSNACYTDHIIRASMKEGINRRFVRYSLQQSIDYVVVDSVSLPTWSASLWNNQIIAWPSTREQEEITDYLDVKCAEIDVIIEKKEELVAGMEAYKKSLIYEYVTGKKEVPACQ